ncbi:hypothetical protein [Leptospira meyeri]|uniref:AbiTii domain-containing protein n=1 Tax=Leptospira meyeri TaxID=29508 RepID=UPI0010846F89|nr:hypothetical protein [Leptospira meyeri]TGM19420.1 hypothetical protein EHQ73_14055 [Leptospira meyeri]
MDSTIKIILKEAMDTSTNVSDLIRKTYVVANQLNLKDITLWAHNELYGYKGETDLPTYRTLPCEIKVLNPYHGYQPLIIQDAKLSKLLSTAPIPLPIHDIETLINTTEKNGTNFATARLPDEIRNFLMKGMNVSLIPEAHLSIQAIHGLINSVRNAVLEWMLLLNKDGISGADLLFTESEREKASAQTINYNLVVDQLINSQIQQGTTNSSQNSMIDIAALKEWISSVEKGISELGIRQSDEENLKKYIKLLQEDLTKDPNFNINKASIFASIKAILEGAGGNLLASGALYQLSKFLS